MQLLPSRAGRRALVGTALVAALPLLLAACPGDGPVIPDPLSVAVTGILERGEVVTVVVRDGAAVLDPAAITLSSVPTHAIEVTAPGQVRLLATGTVEIQASWGTRTGSHTLEVAEPTPLAVEVAGTLERGEVVTVTVRSRGEVVDPASVQLALVPAGAGELLGGGQVRLMQTGTAEIRATLGVRTGSATVEVAEPPELAVEVSGLLERTEIVTVTVRYKDEVVDSAAVQLAVIPAGAGELLGGGQVRLMQTGTVEIRATWGTRTGGRTVQVAEPPPLDVQVAGRLERGSTVVVTVRNRGEVMDPDGVRLTVLPQGAVELLAGGEVRLLTTGSVQITAEAAARTGSATVTVAAPPVIVFDMLRDGNRDVWRVALDGGELVRLTDHGAEDSGPTAAQGRVTFTSYRTGNGELFSLPLAGGDATRLTTTSATETAVAARPDGQRLAYASDATGVHKLWVANTDGTSRQAALTGFGYAGAIESSPSWAPTGNRLVFMSTAGGSADLWTVNLDGGAPVLLAGGTGAYVNPAWSPNGAHVAFSSTRDGSPAQIYLVEVATGTITRLTTRGGTDGEPTWTPDGRLVYVAFDGAQTQLRWLDPASPATTHAIPTGSGTPRRPAGVR
jgi:hypothetical protein